MCTSCCVWSSSYVALFFVWYWCWAHDAVSIVSFSTPFFVIIFDICYLLFAIWYLLFAICYLLFAICYLLFAICYLLFAICYLLFAIYYFFICFDTHHDMNINTSCLASRSLWVIWCCGGMILKIIKKRQKNHEGMVKKEEEIQQRD